MIIRADHVAGGAFIALGILVFAISGDLPFGRLSAPGAGMMPKLMAGPDDAVRRHASSPPLRARSPPLATIDWSDRGARGAGGCDHRRRRRAYRPLGFLITMSLLVFALLVVVERRNVARRRGVQRSALTLFAYWLFGKALKSPLERGVLWF